MWWASENQTFASTQRISLKIKKWYTRSSHETKAKLVSTLE